MRWRDVSRLALRSLRRRRGRAALTVVAVGLATGLLVALITIAQTAESRVITQIGRGGPTSAIKVVAAQPNPFQPTADNPSPGKAHDIDAAALRAIAALPDVSAVTPVVQTDAILQPLGPLRSDPASPSPAPGAPAAAPGLPSSFFDSLIGVDFRASASLPLTVVAGRLPNPDSATEVVVTEDYLDHVHLSPNEITSVLGAELQISEPQFQPATSAVRVRSRTVRAVIVGVVAEQLGDGHVLIPLAQAELAREWAVGGVTDQDIPRATSLYSGLFVDTSSFAALHTVRQAITDMGYSTSAPEQLVASVQNYLHVVDIVLGAIGLVALVIAALGIVDAMLAAVRERRREIATFKAIGGRDRDVLLWFVTEAGVVGVLGGLVGALLGLAVAVGVGLAVNNYLLQQGLAGVDVGGIPFAILGAGVAGATVLSVIAGALPAWRAARLPAYLAIGGEA